MRFQIPTWSPAWLSLLDRKHPDGFMNWQRQTDVWDTQSKAPVQQCHRHLWLNCRPLDNGDHELNYSPVSSCIIALGCSQLGSAVIDGSPGRQHLTTSLESWLKWSARFLLVSKHSVVSKNLIFGMLSTPVNRVQVAGVT